MAAGHTGKRWGMASRAPGAPTDLSKRSWMATLKRTFREFQDDNVTDWAAALTYYAVLALFPALIALVAIVGLVADPVTITNTLTKLVSRIGPASAVDTFKGPIRQITANRSTAGIALVISLATSLWAASGYIGAFMRASNTIYEVEEGRPFWRLRPLQVVVTLVMVLLVAVTVLALVVTGPLASGVGDAVGVGSTAVTIWDIAKWPVLIVVVLGMFGFLYHVSPNVRLPKFKWVTPGSVLALVTWGVASAVFAFYVANFGSYNKTYGTLAGAVVFLVWLWITNIAILLGAELNAELERSREIEAGVPGAEREIQLEPRSAPKEDAHDRTDDRQVPQPRASS
jgi:membrane protein